MKSTTRPPRRRVSRSPRPSNQASQRPGVAVWVWIAIPTAVLIAYWPALCGGMLWDDEAHVTKPSLQSIHGLWSIWFSLGTTQQYYPLLHSAFWVEHRLWGDAVLGYHLANLAQHALAACLVVVLVRRLMLPGAWLAGLIFALHPVCVEAVAWISEQKSTLSADLYLGSTLVYLHFDQTRRRSYYFWALGLFVLALLTKTVTATLPAALLVVFWWRRGRLDWRRDVRPLLPWLTLGAAAGLFTAWVERAFVGAQGPNYAMSPIQRFLLACRVICFYAAKLIWPVNLIFSYPRWKVNPAAPLQYLYVMCVLAAAIWFYLLARKKSATADPSSTTGGEAARAPLAMLLLFSGTLFPVLGFLNVFPFVYSFVADHFQYLASLAIIVPAAVVAARATSRISGAKAAVGAVMLLGVLGSLTFRQSADYRDLETLYRTTLARNPDSWMVHNNLGNLLVQMPGREWEAIAEYRAALRLFPTMADAHCYLGIALARAGRVPDGIAELQTALRIAPNYVEAHNNLGAILLSVPGRRADAIAEFRAALVLRPNDPDIRRNLQMAMSNTFEYLAPTLREERQP